MEDGGRSFIRSQESRKGATRDREQANSSEAHLPEMAVYHRGADALPLGIAQLELSEYVSMGFEAYGWSAGGGGGCGSCGAGAAHRTAVRLKRELSVNFGSCLSIVSYLNEL